ncbi:nitrate transporter [Phyllobacterium phragmitis]|uniref:Nitrate transporter n=1 Tax=Phyllobacterium phragmitis TaxID=2670329 RepID=A0A2S9IVS2_9HYPH|nr:CmpA/NrtA family ABC transporter substrate-binding protein [Phyllobacterium phragmitis]PRD44631.1 nitrate transporter [Phyllobacterium phragmitis]
MTDGAEITIGFLPLLDSAILIAAAEKGFARDEHIDVNLVRETSWANIRDRVAVGHFEAAHMLAPMPIASNLGLSPLSVPLIAPMALGLGGNAVTASVPLYEDMSGRGMAGDLDPADAGRALKTVIAARSEAGMERLRIAVVHPFSGHNYELRYWLTACGVDPERDVDIIVVPPPLMPDALASGNIDMCCVGEPWNSVAVSRGSGRIITVKARIWRNSPEKVLGVTSRWANAQGDVLDALLRALYRAAEWCAGSDNAEELAAILSRPQWLNVDEKLVLGCLTGALATRPDHIVQVDDFFVRHAKAATFPWQSHALWFYSQMVRWGQCGHSAKNAVIARDSYRPDIYRRALKPLPAPLPGANLKVEGALSRPQPVGASKAGLVLGPDGFFDGRIFDPDAIDAYIAGQNGHRGN